MSLNTQAYLAAAYPPPLHKPCELPRLFLLRWNNSKLRSNKGRIDKNAWHEAYGVRWPNGRVSLDFGPAYDMMHDLEVAYGDMGTYKLEWLGEQEANT